MSRFGIRTKLLLVVASAVAAALAALIVGFNVLLVHTLSRNADSLVRARAGAEVALLRPENGRLAAYASSSKFGNKHKFHNSGSKGFRHAAGIAPRGGSASGDDAVARCRIERFRRGSIRFRGFGVPCPGATANSISGLFRRRVPRPYADHRRTPV